MRSWQVLKLWGVPFKIHSNWFLLFFLFSWSISNQINLTSSQIYNIRESWLIGFFTSFLFLGSIIFHQIVHTFVCLKEGVKIKTITFFFLGAILNTEKDCHNALGNIKISLVRPVLCFITSFFLLYISYLNDSKEIIFINIISRVSFLNLFLGLLHLIPVGYLDGGNLFKSVVWYLSGSKKKGRNLLNKITLILSLFTLIIGFFFIFNSNFYYGIIISLLALFGINSSKSESQFMKIENILKNNDITKLKLKPLRKIEHDLNFRQFNKLIKIYREKSDKYFFVTNNGRWEGFLTSDNLKDVSIKKWDLTLVGDYKKSINNFPKINQNIPLWKIIEKIESTNEGILLVVNSIGIPKGIIDRNKIGYFVLKELGLNISIDLINKIKSDKNYPLGMDLPKIINVMKRNGDI